jgi:hypothetical protein
MLNRIIAASKYFVTLRAGDFENRQFSFWEALLDTWYEFFS